MTQLTNSLAARDAARSHHQEAAAALERARQVHKDAEAEAERLAGEEGRWVERYSKRLSEWIAAGSKGSSPAIASDAKAQQALSTARASAAAAVQALATFEAAEREARQALTAAEAAVDRELCATLAAEGDREASEIIEDEAKLETRRNRLRGLRELVPPTVLVRRAAPMEGDWVHIPMPELRSPTSGGPLHTPLNKIGTAEVDPAAVEHWRSRRASLLSGDDSPPSASTEERAA